MVTSDFEGFSMKIFWYLKRTNFLPKFTTCQVSFFFFTFCILREFCQNLKTLIVSKQLKKKSWNLFSARLYQRTGAKPEVDREVHSRGLMAQRVTREVSILFIKFHECQAWFHFLWPYVGKNTENKFYEGEFWAEIPWTKKNDRKSCTFCVFTGKIFDFFQTYYFSFYSCKFTKIWKAKSDFPGYFLEVFHIFSTNINFLRPEFQKFNHCWCFFCFHAQKNKQWFQVYVV